MLMEVYSTLVLFFFLSSSAAVNNTISPNQPIKDGDTIVSDGEMYELGFFSPGKSTNRYLGIWYNKISKGTVVWVANRETPISDLSGVFQVTTEGSLILGSGNYNQTVIWSSDTTTNAINPVAQLLDSGNLVVWDESSTKENPIWQSFDFPGNTLLPGMKFGKDLIRDREKSITTWKSPDDPSIGLYKMRLDPNGYPQVFVGEGGVDIFRLAPWNGLGFRGIPVENTNPIYSVEFVVNDKEIYYKYELIGSVIQRIIVMSDGILLHLSWINRTQQWVVYGSIAVDSCSQYRRCGPYGSCFINTYPPCRCMEGFEVKVPEEWNAGDWSSGCQRITPLNCIGTETEYGTRTGTETETVTQSETGDDRDHFRKISGVKFPDTRRSWYNVSMSLGECEIACRRNCSCTAYANLDIRNGGSGCLLWFDDLIDIGEHDDPQGVYIRLATSKLAEKGQSSFNKKNRVLTMVLCVSSAALILCAVAYTCIKKKKVSHKKRRGNCAHKDDTSVHMEDLDELPFLSQHTIAKATNNFSIYNKIGEGGFGPVYKGVLEDGQVIAVKRLSETSEQGLDEFRNEVICIAKLQHRNLVKLLGYCIHGNEKILIYEYMENKGLDSFIFDETKSSMLDWPRRFGIIHGIARGILYLHQDSRLQIIHRDLKAGNILLDSEMNPKISDFGLARKFVGQESMAKTNNVVGTYGYISPEYAVHGEFSTMSDVFSFGVLVLEIVSGKKNRGFSYEGHSDNLLGHAWRLYREDKSIELMSTSLRNSCFVSEVLRSIHVGLLCVQHHAEDRPTMLSVVLLLTSDGALPPPKEPAFYGEESCRQLGSVSLVEEYISTLL